MKIYISIRPGPIGGPSVFVKNFVEECVKRGHKIVYDVQKDCDCGLVISTTNEEALKKLKKYGIKTIIRLDGFYIPEYWDNRKGRKMTLDKIQVNNVMRKDLKRYDEVIFQSNWSKKMFDRWLGERKDHFTVIHNGVNTKKFKPLNRGIKNSVIMVGALRHAYMANTFFGAMNIFYENKGRANWLLAGTMDKVCKKIYSQYAARPGVKYLGPASNDQLVGIYNKANVLLHPRAGDSCPNVVLEAMACGLPVVCASWGGAAELVGKAGVIAEIDKWGYGRKYETKCFQGIKEILENPKLYSNRAIKRINKHFTIEKTVDNYLEVMRP
ncbi:MAG: hypothetical protein B7C24_06820 [Bacteroidetes bacterium 4572_77]|nr:MAG: hypothetical protein B7C24_06820 [Bacteroidetes bacterium 4572_77]